MAEEFEFIPKEFEFMAEEFEFMAEEFEFMAEEFEFMAEEFEFVPEEFEFVPKEFEFIPKEFEFMAEEFEFVPKEFEFIPGATLTQRGAEGLLPSDALCAGSGMWLHSMRAGCCVCARTRSPAEVWGFPVPAATSMDVVPRKV